MNIVDKTKLDNLFNIEDNNTSVATMPSTNIVTNDTEVNTEKQEYVETELKNLLQTSNDILLVAKDVISTTPDAETIESASKMIASMSTIITELNKSILINQKLSHLTQLEKMKIEARQQLAEYRASLGPKGDVNIQNNLINYSQEELIKLLNKNKDLNYYCGIAG